MTIFDQRESAIRAYCRVYPAVFERAVGSKIFDQEGKEYIDFFAGAGVLNFGHNDPKMTSAVVDYIQSGGILHSLDLHTVAKARFMEKFTKIILEPRGMDHRMQFMGPTGTNAVEAAMKLARNHTGRQEIVAFSHGFHGMTLGALAATANEAFRCASGVPLNHVRHFPFGCEKPCKDCKLGCGMESIERLRALYADTSSGVPKPAAFLLETIQAEGGVNVASKEWVLEIKKLAKEIGALLIIDEIQVGCGRTGSYFSFDGWDLDPDIVTLAKGIGGLGTPIAMNLVKPEVDDTWKPGQHTGTFRGQNISFVAGAEALDYFLDDELTDAVREKGKIMEDALAPVLAENPDFQLRGKGMILGLDVGSGEISKKIVGACFEAGLMIASCGTGGRVVKLIPPLNIDTNDMKKGLEILVQAATTARKA